VAPQVGEKVVRVYAREGDRVQAGALLFELDPALFEKKVAYLEAKLVEAVHQVKQLEAELAAARAGHERLVADADYAAAVHRQENAIFSTDSTTERRYLEARDDRERRRLHRAGRVAQRRHPGLAPGHRLALLPLNRPRGRPRALVTPPSLRGTRAAVAARGQAGP
jgi:multidrug resistance efflux pump